MCHCNHEATAACQATEAARERYSLPAGAHSTLSTPSHTAYLLLVGWPGCAVCLSGQCCLTGMLPTFPPWPCTAQHTSSRTVSACTQHDHLGVSEWSSQKCPPSPTPVSPTQHFDRNDPPQMLNSIYSQMFTVALHTAHGPVSHGKQFHVLRARRAQEGV